MGCLNIVALNLGINEARERILSYDKNAKDENISINLNNGWINVNYENEDITINIELSSLNGELFISFFEVY